MKRFKIGGRARVVANVDVTPGFEHFRGRECTITALDHMGYSTGRIHDYEITFDNGEEAAADDHELEPVTRPGVGSWKAIEQVVGWNPSTNHIS